MSRIREASARMCPEGVRYARLADISATIPGLSGKSKADFSNGNARFVTYKQVYADPSVDPVSAAHVRIHPRERQHRLRLGDIIFTGSSEGAHDVGMSSVVVSEPNDALYLNSFCFAIRIHDRDLLLPDFSKHLFRSEPVRAQIRRAASGVTRINISKRRFASISIPIPPLELQLEIARVLDGLVEAVVELDAQLKAELHARQDQYDFYRDVLLDRRQDEMRMSLGDLLQMRAGRHISARALSSVPTRDHVYPAYGANGVRGYAREFTHEGASILVGRQGALSGNVRRVQGRFYATEHAVVVGASGALDRNWLFHRLTAMDLIQYASRGAQPGLAVGTLKSLPISVPPLDKQVRIAQTLDGFEALVHELSKSLGNELTARRKQYEHYRDSLLTFKELAA